MQQLTASEYSSFGLPRQMFIATMRHLLGPGEAYKERKDGDIITVPAGLTLFHGSNTPFDPMSALPGSFYATHLVSPFALPLEKWRQCGPTCDPRVLEFVTTRPIRLLVRNANYWNPATRWYWNTGQTLSRFGFNDLMGADGDLSAYGEEEMRVNLPPRDFLRLVKVHTLQQKMIQYVATGKPILQPPIDWVNQTDLYVHPRKLPTDFMPPRLSETMVVEEVAHNNRLLAYSLLCQAERAPSNTSMGPPAVAAAYLYGLYGVVGHYGSADTPRYRLCVAWKNDPTADNGVFKGESIVSDITSTQQPHFIPPDLHRVCLALGGWTWAETKDLLWMNVYGIGPTTPTPDESATTAVEDMIMDFFYQKLAQYPSDVFQSKFRMMIPRYNYERLVKREPRFVRIVNQDPLYYHYEVMPGPDNPEANFQICRFEIVPMKRNLSLADLKELLPNKKARPNEDLLQ